MDKIIYLILAASIFIFAAITMITLSSDAITDVFSFRESASSSSCELQCSRIKSGDSPADSYTASCYQKHECDAADENAIILQNEGIEEALTS